MSDDFALQVIQRGKESDGAVAIVIVGLSADMSFAQRQTRLTALQRLDLALLVTTEHHGLLWRIEVKTDDIPKFRLKIRIAGKLKDTRQVWLDFVLTPDSLHRRLGDIKLPSHRAASPSYPALRWPGGLVDDLAQQFGADLAFAARAGLALQRPNPPSEIAMFGWPMEEEAKLEFTITVNWRREDGSMATTQLETLDHSTCRSAEDVGLQLADAKPILARLQKIVVREQLERYCETVRPCPRCHRRRHLKDYRSRRFDTVFGRLGVRAPRFDGCPHCGERLIASPVSELLPDRVNPKLRHLQTQFAARLPYRQAAALLEELLPETGAKLCHDTQPNARCR